VSSKNIKTHIKIYTAKIGTALYGCKTCSFTFREEHRLRVFENIVLRRIFGAQEGQGNRAVEKIT